LANGRERLGSLAGRLEALSPLGVLARGYSLTRTEDGAVVRDSAQVRPGERVFVQLGRGRLVGRIEECHGPAEPAIGRNSEDQS
jgi:exodeoxyribonuclease VII large subunit